MPGRFRMFFIFGATVMVLADWMPRAWIRHDLDPNLAIVVASAFIACGLELAWIVATRGIKDDAKPQKPAPTAGQE